MSKRPPGIPSNILQNTLQREASPTQRLASDVADQVCNSTQLNSLEQFKTKGLMAGGAALAADGFRRLVTKDEDGKTHRIRGAVQTVVGAGVFTAALNYERSHKITGLER